MKKLILTSGILLSTSLWASPMDDICNIHGDDFGQMQGSDWKKLANKCERNNILEGKGFRLDSLTFFLNSYCRFDRNVWYEEIKDPDMYDFGCVLYAPEGRSRIID